MVLIEHRYFAECKAEPMDLKFRTIVQSANDHHHVDQLMKQVLTGKYISTGISEVGQTAMYYKYYFPDDVEVSVPYVGPVNFSIVDERINPFINNINGKECRNKFRDFQIYCLEQHDDLMPAFNKLADAAGQHFTWAQGNKAAFEYMVLEYRFAFWQWGALFRAQRLLMQMHLTALWSATLWLYRHSVIFRMRVLNKCGRSFTRRFRELALMITTPPAWGNIFDDVHDLTFSFFSLSNHKLKFKKKYMKRVEKFLKKN